MAILNANYVAARLADHYDIHFSGGSQTIKGGGVAHECILDLRPLKETSGVSAEDVAKRLIDYGFHAPTLSFPVAGTLMVEPTESESQAELDRFCDAMIAIREEIRQVEQRPAAKDDNLLKTPSHGCKFVVKTEWTHSYSREAAVFTQLPACASRNTGRQWAVWTTSTATAICSALACPSATTRPDSLLLQCSILITINAVDPSPLGFSLSKIAATPVDVTHRIG